MQPTLSIVISSKDRPSEICTLISSILQQSVLPTEIVIYDDSRTLQYPDFPAIKNLLLYATNIYNINIYLKKGLNGAARNYQDHIHTCSCDFIFRIDDDCILCNKNTIKNYFLNWKSKMILSSSIIDPSLAQYKTDIQLNTIEHIDQNVQWQKNEKKIENNEHLYSSFFFNKNEIIKDEINYPLILSSASHREETIFSHRAFLKDYNLVILPQIIYHLRSPHGGIRTNIQQDYNHDETVFRKWLEVKNNTTIYIVEVQGIGDQLVFIKTHNELWNKYKDIFEQKKIKLSVRDKSLHPLCDFSVATEEEIMINELGIYPQKHSIYNWCAKRNWNKSLSEAYEIRTKEILGI